MKTGRIIIDDGAILKGAIEMVRETSEPVARP